MNKGLAVWDVDNSRSLDVICVGRVAVDLYAEQIGSSLDDAQTFRKYLGGCAGNIAVGTARLGLRSSLFSRVGSDAMGQFLLKQLTCENVDTSLVKVDDGHLTGLVLLGVNPPDDFPLIFYRNQCADEQIDIRDLSDESVAKSKSLLLTGTLFAKAHLRQLAFDAIAKAKKARSKVILDIDYRPVLWGLTAPGEGATRFISSQAVSNVLKDVLAQCDLIVGTQEEFLIASGSTSIESAIAAVRSLTSAMLVVKKGANGSEAIMSDGQRIACEPYQTQVLNVLGAGDAFMSGLLYGLFRGEAILKSLQYANACGSIVVSRHGCSPAMPSEEEMKALVEGRRAFRKEQKNSPPLLIAAFDHRDFFEASLPLSNPSSSTPFATIARFKHAIAGALGSSASMLIDPIYGLEALKLASEQGSVVGAPIEKAGAFPLEWIEERPLYQQILERPANWFVKVLVRFHPLMEESHQRVQLAKLCELNQVCMALERKLMLELLLPDSESCQDADIADIADAIATLYRHHITPTWWKIEAPPTARTWERVVDVIHEFDPSARVIILGKNKSFEELGNDFRRVASSSCAIGFAVGRTLFAEPWKQFMQNEISADEAGQRVAENFQQCVLLWEQAH